MRGKTGTVRQQFPLLPAAPSPGRGGEAQAAFVRVCRRRRLEDSGGEAAAIVFQRAYGW